LTTKPVVPLFAVRRLVAIILLVRRLSSSPQTLIALFTRCCLSDFVASPLRLADFSATGSLRLQRSACASRVIHLCSCQNAAVKTQRDQGRGR
jgi:hypothetical protein